MKCFILIGLLLSFRIHAQEADTESFLENEDFEQTKEINYDKENDSINVTEKKENIFSKETLSHLNEDEVDSLSISSKPDAALDNLIILCRQKKFDEALELSRSIYPQYIKHPSYWNILGNCYYLKKNFIAAFIYYNKALGFDSHYNPALNNIAVLHLKEGKITAALKKFNQTKPTPVTLFNKAQLELRYGLIDEAFNDLKKINDAGSNNEINLTLAQLTLIIKSPTDAMVYFNKLTKAELFRPDVGLNYALTLLKLGKKSAAEDSLDSTEVPEGKNPYQNYLASIKNNFFKEN